MTRAFIILSFLVISSNSQRPKPVPGYNIEEELYYDTFPDEFIWGAATAAYQVKSLFLIIFLKYVQNCVKLKFHRLKEDGMKMEKD